MEAHEVTPANLHLAVGLLLTNQQGITRRLDAQDVVLGAIKEQTIRTNGRVLAAESAIVECKAGIKDAMAKGGCPGVCIDLDKKVRALEDARERNSGRVESATWIMRGLWAVGAGLVSFGAWLLGRGSPSP